MSETKSTVSTPRSPFRALLFLVLLVLAAITGFAFHERNSAKLLAVQNEQVSAALSQTHTQIDATRQQIDDTRQDLAGTRTELQGSIARTHDELVVLQKRGEHNYYEFDLTKAKQFQRAGSLGVRLKKANSKRKYADLELMVDDADVSQKHVNIFQPVIFYAGDNGRPVEVVINKITSNHIHGYVSEPKYRQSELASMSNANTNNSASSEPVTAEPTATASTPRRKLPLPK